MNVSEYLRFDATGLAGLVAGKEIAPEELLEIAWRQNERAHAKINAVCRLMEPQARKQAAGPLTGPFAGVPFLIKDAFHDYAGLPTSLGSRAFANVTAPAHANVVRRYLGAGLVIFGKTNLPELALKAVTDSRLFGRACNPWDLGRTPGGSSGGAAAAVAAGIVPMAAANDGGGSIRIPAAYCGLFGLKPSRGRVSLAPAWGESWFGGVAEGVISRSVRDSARALDLLQGPEPGDPFVIAPPAESYAVAIERPPQKLRIGFSGVSPIGLDVHPEAIAAVENAAALLRGLGHEVEEAAPEIDGDMLARDYLCIYFGVVGAMIAEARKSGATGGDFEMLTRVLGALGSATPAPVLARSLWRWNDYARALAKFHARYDLFMTPTVAFPAIRHGEGDPPPAQEKALDLLERTGLLKFLARTGLLHGTVDEIARQNLRFVPFTQLANMTGAPAMSVPLHWTADNLPLGVQFVGRFGAEDILLRLARQLEEAQPWFDRLPAWVTAPTEARG